MELDSIKSAVHFSVSAAYAVTTIYTAYLAASLPQEYYKNDIFRLGRDYFAYFLCFWLMLIHHIYFGAYTALDIIDRITPTKFLIKLSKDLEHLGSYLLFSIVFPFGVVISTGFWSLFVLEREKMYPKVIDEALPFWHQHFMHTYPLPLSVLYMAMSNKHLPSKVSTFCGLAVFQAVYAAFFMKYRMMTGKWLYLMLDESTPVQNTIVLLYGFLGPFVFLFVGYKLNSVLNDVKSRYFKFNAKTVKCE